MDRVLNRAVAARRLRLAALGLLASLVWSVRLDAQLINEVIADNETQTPLDVGGGTPDMVELFNDTNGSIVLGASTEAQSYALTDSLEFDPESAYFFPDARASFGPGGRLVVFCDGNEAQNACELHAPFNLSSDGSEPVVLWGPEDGGGQREIVDRVFLPPLRRDVSFGRFPDGEGGANMTVEEHLENMVFYPPGRTSFGNTCANIPGNCPVNGASRRHCSGASNRVPLPSDNVAPRVDRVFESTNAPAANEVVDLIARVRDDGEPIPSNITSVEIVYRVQPAGGEFGVEQSIEMDLDESVGEGGILSAADRGRPLDLFSLWTGTIPGQSAGSRVEFFLRVTDEAGATTTRPRNLCHAAAPYDDDDGPCDREFGPSENGCELDAEDETCVPDEEPEEPEERSARADGGGADSVIGLRYFSCTTRSTYKVAHAPADGKASVVINEVVPAQAGLLRDPSEVVTCSAGVVTCDTSIDPDCCHKDEDFLEIFNGANEPVDLSGCFLSDSFFQPQAWKFPEGSIIPTGEYVIVWLDRDGSKCPNPDVLTIPCFWECPDPNVQSMQRDPPQFHANFAINADGDQIFLFDTEDAGYGLIHGVDFGTPSDICGFTPGENMMGEPTDDVRPNQSLALSPNGDPNGQFVIVDSPTPGSENDARCGDAPLFRRGDASGDGALDLSDGVRILNFLFTGGSAPPCRDAADTDDTGLIDIGDAIAIFNFLFLGGGPPAAPGPNTCGPDVAEDGLPECDYTAC